MEKREYNAFQRFVYDKYSSNHPLKFCEYLLENERISESALLKFVGLSKRNKYYILEQISESIVEFLNNSFGNSEGKGHLIVAKRLVYEMQEEAAITFLRQGFQLAEESESFGVLMELNEIQKSITLSESISKMTNEWILTQLKLVEEFENFSNKLSSIRHLSTFV